VIVAAALRSTLRLMSAVNFASDDPVRLRVADESHCTDSHLTQRRSFQTLFGVLNANPSKDGDAKPPV